ncbi:MAG: hypothetical protein EOQ89_03440 [Mesorhizobium sp.]|nr:MAG: hypothetical protein EOQ89_03440 [Mesorhizobium sp.]
MSERLKINIYDSGNRQRLLGYVFADRLDRRPSLGRTPTETMQWGCVSRLWYADPRRQIPKESFRTVTLKVEDDVVAPSNTYGWVKQFCLTTSASLEDLLQMELFHLPGESPKVQARRLNAQRWAD